MPQPLTLMMQEFGFGSVNKDDFVISDEQGRHWFTLKAAHITMSNSRSLLDASGRPLVTMSNKLVSLHKSWIMSRADGVKLAEIKPSLMAVISPSIKVYLQDGDKEADFVVKVRRPGRRAACAACPSACAAAVLGRVVSPRATRTHPRRATSVPRSSKSARCCRAPTASWPR